MSDALDIKAELDKIHADVRAAKRKLLAYLRERDTPTDTQGEGWRYFVYTHDDDSGLWRAKPTGSDEVYDEELHRWDVDFEPLSWWLDQVHSGAARELTEAEAVERFGPEILDEPPKAEEEQPQPREDKPKTLADEAPYVLCELLTNTGEATGFAAWRDHHGNVIAGLACGSEYWLSGDNDPSTRLVGRALGHVVISHEPRSKSVADAEREELRELREKVQRLETTRDQLVEENANLMAMCHENRQAFDSLHSEAERLAATVEKAHEERDELAEKLGRVLPRTSSPLATSGLLKDVLYRLPDGGTARRAVSAVIGHYEAQQTQEVSDE